MAQILRFPLERVRHEPTEYDLWLTRLGRVPRTPADLALVVREQIEAGHPERAVQTINVFLSPWARRRQRRHLRLALAMLARLALPALVRDAVVRRAVGLEALVLGAGWWVRTKP